MIQDNLPNFDKAMAEVREKDITLEQTTDRLASFYARMDKCKDPKIIPLCRKQKKALAYYFTLDYQKSRQRG